MYMHGKVWSTMKKKKRSGKPLNAENDVKSAAEAQSPAPADENAEKNQSEDNAEFQKAVSALADATGIITVMPPKEEEKKPKKHNISEIDDQVKEIIDDALDENVENLGISDDSIPQGSGVSLSQVLTTLFGLIVIGFAVFGIISAGIKIHDYNEYKKSNIEQIEYFERLILPLSACDAPTFESVSALNSDVVISAACWDIILSPSPSYVAENGYYKISYLDVDARINKLFGKGLTYTHGTVGDEELIFEYDESIGMYSIPAAPRAIAYFATVDSIEPSANGYTLTVSYRLPVTSWISVNASAEKIMIFNVTGSGASYSISSLEIKEIVNTQGL